MSLNDPMYSKPARTHKGPTKTQRLKELREIKRNATEALRKNPNDELNRVLRDLAVSLIKLEK